MDEITIDVDSLTLGDLEEGEKLAGKDFTAALEGKATSMAAMVVLIFLAKRKGEPMITLDEVRALPLSALGNVKVVSSSTPFDAAESSR